MDNDRHRVQIVAVRDCMKCQGRAQVAYTGPLGSVTMLQAPIVCSGSWNELCVTNQLWKVYRDAQIDNCL